MVKIAAASAWFCVAQASTLKVDWTDCGDSATHAKVTELSPTAVTTGKATILHGKGTLDEDVAGATFSAVIKANGVQVASCSGDASKDIVCNLPLNAGHISVKAMSFPLKAGEIPVDAEVKLSSLIPGSLAKATSHVAAVSDTGDKLVCLDIKTSKQQPTFDEWAAEYGINGDDARENYNRKVLVVDELNARDSSATYAVNRFSGMSHEEFAAVYLNLKQRPTSSTDLPALEMLTESAQIDDAVDWDVTPVKDQGQCGSCWTFGVMGAIEGLNKVVTGKEVILSEQQLVDCDKDGINDGCNGGLTDYAYKYLTGKDLFTLGSYPYVSGKSGHGNSCQSGTPSGVSISGYLTVDGAGSGSRGDSALATALMTGPVTITVAADNQFANYHSGIMTGVPTQCNLNHAILATGFGPNFWKIKNSWGSSWGDAGFAKFERSTSGCGPFGIFFQDAGFQPKLASMNVLV